MNKIEIFGIVFLISFMVIFIIHYFVVTKPKLKKIFEGEKTKKTQKRKKDKAIEVVELNYLVTKFKLNKDKLNWKSLAFMIAFINSFIMALVVAILELVPGEYYIKLPVAFVLLFALIYSLYEIYGRILKSKEEKERD